MSLKYPFRLSKKCFQFVILVLFDVLTWISISNIVSCNRTNDLGVKILLMLMNLVNFAYRNDGECSLIVI